MIFDLRYTGGMVTQRIKTKKKVTTKKPVATVPQRKTTKPSSKKVDYYPNRMTLAVSALAGTLLVLLALIAVFGSQ